MNPLSAAHDSSILATQLFCVGTPLKYSAQTWDVNSLSRCNSKLRNISSKDLPVGALGFLSLVAFNVVEDDRRTIIRHLTSGTEVTPHVWLRHNFIMNLK